MLRSAFIGMAALALAGCGGGEAEEKEPLAKGQTVATVNGTDITVHELNAELQGATIPNEEARKVAQGAALQALVGRTILADIARERGIDQSPAYLLQRRRANEALLVQMLQGSIAGKLPPPTPTEAQAFMTRNPATYAQRKIYTLDQIGFPMPANPNALREFESIQTMEQLERKLIEDRIQYQRRQGQLDAMTVRPEIAAQIDQLPATEVFLIPAQSGVIANRVISERVEPFSGEQALAHATQLLQQQRVNDALGKELNAKIEQARANVRYQKGYEPPAAAATPAATPAAAPAGAPKAATR